MSSLAFHGFPLLFDVVGFGVYFRQPSISIDSNPTNSKHHKANPRPKDDLPYSEPICKNQPNYSEEAEHNCAIFHIHADFNGQHDGDIDDVDHKSKETWEDIVLEDQGELEAVGEEGRYEEQTDIGEE